MNYVIKDKDGKVINIIKVKSESDIKKFPDFGKMEKLPDNVTPGMGLEKVNGKWFNPDKKDGQTGEK